eukprot:GHRR01008580.1.p1 GENE.GHRR01008580.1~~GHRR01008580.1.p1  ORF type:complete len:234 (+),score=56.31 GHRR01008580.1:151-852(+)
MMPMMGMQPQIILLKEGTDTSQGTPQLVSNINACMALADTVRTTLGPRGMDKLIHDDKGHVTISNDGATIMKLLDVVHPAAKTLVDISLSQDAEVGDGTTTVVILAGEFLRQAKPFVEEGVHPRSIIKSYRQASQLAVEKVKELSVSLEGKGEDEKKELLLKCAATSLNSKLVSTRGCMCVVVGVGGCWCMGGCVGRWVCAHGTQHYATAERGAAFQKQSALCPSHALLGKLR